MKYTEKQIQIIALIKADNQITAKELQSRIELSEKEFYNEIRDLRTKGVLTHVGMVNAGTWVLDENPTKTE